MDLHLDNATTVKAYNSISSSLSFLGGGSCKITFQWSFVEDVGFQKNTIIKTEVLFHHAFGKK